jgi:hypothetical protein
MNAELERIRKKAAVILFPEFFLEILRNSMENLSGMLVSWPRFEPSTSV